VTPREPPAREPRPSPPRPPRRRGIAIGFAARGIRDRPALRVTVSKALYRGRTELPKSNKVRVIALTPPARDALLALPERNGPVFLSKAGGRLCAPLLSSNWREVQASAGLRFDFYLATKHKCVHHMKVKLNLPNHVIAAQMGWSESAVERMVATYGRTEVGALDAIDAAFATVHDAGPALATTVDRVSPAV
jgi:hypothetical protein